MTLLDVVEILGSLLILVAFAASQAGRLDPKSRVYLTLNLAGSAVLAVIAAGSASWGFLLLEGTWAIVSGLSLIRLLSRRREPAARP
ncbi:CBU_0592 family membrane protein [Hamadaea tsunoensis]|uniref:CBU_0592 family membrane protein n=1 Tax=Hamadaea tsunoensis TaxID=53368 RepID=UPI000555A122|nr:hypothetical protein [Hamadaea tsunoensis]